MNIFAIIGCAVLAWIVLSSLISLATAPVFHLNRLKHHGSWLTKWLPVPCLFALAFMEEKEATIRAKSLYGSGYFIKWYFEFCVLFSLPSRIGYFQAARTCAHSPVDDLRKSSRARKSHDLSTLGSHRCHAAIGHIPATHLLSDVIEAMEYDAIEGLFDSMITDYWITNWHPERRSLISQCRSLDEAESVAAILQRQIDNDKELNDLKSHSVSRSMERDCLRMVQNRVISENNIKKVAGEFRAKVDENPEVPLEILVEFTSDSMV